MIDIPAVKLELDAEVLLLGKAANIGRFERLCQSLNRFSILVPPGAISALIEIARNNKSVVWMLASEAQPIASMRLMAEALFTGRAREAKQREYFGFITQECRRLSALIENVLDVSRIEQNRKNYELAPSDFPALVKSTIQIIEPARETFRSNAAGSIIWSVLFTKAGKSAGSNS